jgi:hypothetical protein
MKLNVTKQKQTDQPCLFLIITGLPHMNAASFILIHSTLQRLQKAELRFYNGRRGVAKF